MDPQQAQLMLLHLGQGWAREGGCGRRGTMYKGGASGLRQWILWAQPSAFLGLSSAFEHKENESSIIALRLAR